MLKVNDGRIVPGLEVQRPDGTRAQFAIYTDKDEALTRDQEPGGLARATLDQIIAAKEMIALDASDGKLDFKVGALELERPRHTIFWSNNSAQAMLLSLMGGDRTLLFNGKRVETTAAFKQWVGATMGLERVGAPIGE